MRTAALVLTAACFATVLSSLPAQSAAPRPGSDDPASRPADYQPSGDYYDWR